MRDVGGLIFIVDIRHFKWEFSAVNFLSNFFLNSRISPNLKIKKRAITAPPKRPRKTKKYMATSNTIAPPTHLSRWDGDTFEYCMHLVSKGLQKYCVYGSQAELLNHFGAIYSQSSELWLGPLDSFNIRSQDACDMNGRAVFLYAEISKGVDDVNVVVFLNGASIVLSFSSITPHLIHNDVR